MAGKKKQIRPINSDVLQSKADVVAAVKKANSSSNTSSESRAEQPANLKHNKLPEKTKKAAAAARKPQPVPEATPPQMPTEDSVAVPRFNLAEKILAEQRRFASERRRKAGPGGSAAGSYAADDTVGAVIREVKDNMAQPVGAAAGADGNNPAVCETPGGSADGAAAQKLLITDIVAREIADLCGRRRRDSLNRKSSSDNQAV